MEGEKQSRHCFAKIFRIPTGHGQISFGLTLKTFPIFHDAKCSSRESKITKKKKNKIQKLKHDRIKGQHDDKKR